MFTRFFLTVSSACLAAMWLVSINVRLASAEDWPMWRYDPGRTAASQNELPDRFEVLWTRKFSPRQQAWDDPLNLDLMTYDRVFEPIVIDGRMLLGFNDRDKLLAIDTNSGDSLWTYYADAPVRLPPAGHGRNVLFCGDDGCLYCVDVRSGQLRWRFNGAPGAQRAIGNSRITSAWPARGGPVIRDGTVYFAASIWPLMGTFIYALDAESGDLQWVNDATGSQYIKQPHSAPSFAGVAPQGAMVATEDLLLVPGGRSVPAAFDRADGTLRYFEINAGGKGTGGSFLAADETHFYVHTRLNGTRAFKLANGVKTAFMPNQPVLHDGVLYASTIEDNKPMVRAYGADQKPIWEIECDASGDLILAGSSLVAAGKDLISVIRLPRGELAAEIVATVSAPQEVERLLVADKKLFAVTIDGQIIAFGPRSPDQSRGEPANPVQLPAIDQPPGIDQPSAIDQASGIDQPSAIDQPFGASITRLLAAGDADGYAFWFGASDSPLAKALYDQSPFVELAVIDDDAAAVESMRRVLDRRDIYGRVTVHHSNAYAYRAPHYVANMIFVDCQSVGPIDKVLLTQLYRSVRPYGGVMHLINCDNAVDLAGRVESMGLEKAKVESGRHSVTIRRPGALPGAADWTHQYGDVANTIKSNDRRVKLPLGVLWFGGNSNLDVLPRHGHGPPEQVVGGRLFIQGMNSLTARDVYTGRVLWKRTFDDLGTFDVYYDATYEDTPLNPKYNQVHIPGANGRGTNYVVTADRVYIVEGAVCHVLDPATGQTITEITLPTTDQVDQLDMAGAEWGYIGVYKDVLIGGLGFARYRQRHDLTFPTDKDLKRSRAGFGSKSLDRAASVALVGFDRFTGEVLWTRKANHSFWHNGIVAGGDQIYCLDRNPTPVEQAMMRRGISRPSTYRILAIDYRSGEPRWEINEVFGTWLSYSEEFDLLLQAGAAASDRLTSESNVGMAVYRADDGSLKWKRESLKYTGPCILHNDLIITNTNSYSESAGAFYLRDGTQKLVPNPITGKMQPWKLTRAYGCNNIIASENLLTFRSGAAGYYDLLTDAGTGNLGGFKSGCTSNLVVANGVLNAPDYTRTCSCAYQNQTSLALVHMPDVELWSVNTAASAESQGDRIERVGINFGAPGDRRDSDGLLWLEHPIVAGASPPISIRLNEQARTFRHHSSVMSPHKASWILSSGVNDVTDLRIALRLQDKYDLKTGIPVTHTDDDAEEGEDGSVSLGSSDLKLVQDSGNQLVGMRFNDLQIARGAKIREAYVQFTCDEPSTGPASLIITAEDTANAARFSGERHDLSSRPQTSVEVGWSPGVWLVPDAATEIHRTPNLAELVQTVVGRDDWQTGNSLALLISGSGKRVASSFRSDPSKSARLVVELEDADSQPLSGAAAGDPFQVRLLFGSPPSEAGKTAVFDIIAQGKHVRSGVTLTAMENGGAFAIESLENVAIADQLHLQFVPKQGKVALSGIELTRQYERESH